MSSKSERARRAREARIEAERAERAARARRRKLQVGAIAALAAVLVGVLIAVSQTGDDGDEEPSPERRLRGVTQHETALGDPDAPYTLVEFGDPQCPFCAEFDRDVMPTLVSDYVRSGRLRIEFRPLTFIGPDSEEAARMALAVGLQDHFWDYLDLLYRNQGTENSGYVDDSFLTSLAERIPGVDVGAAQRRRDSAPVDEALERARDQASAAGIDSTPSFLIGCTGRRPRPLEIPSLDPGAFSAALEAQIGGPGGG